MYLHEAIYEGIKQIVVQTFVTYDVQAVPVQGFELASKMGIALVPYSAYKPEITSLMEKLSEDAFILNSKPGCRKIFYNDKIENYSRLNFSILHEIGHYVLEHSVDSQIAESEANFFAKYALVPPVLVEKLKIKDFVQLSEVFHVSLEMARNSWSYFQKWKKFGGLIYTDYELAILEQFKKVG